MAVHPKGYGAKRGREDGSLERNLYENGLFRTRNGLWTVAERALILSMQVTGEKARQAYRDSYLETVLN